MNIITVQASTGVQWVKQGIQTFARKPFSLLLIFFLCALFVGLASLLPFPANLVALVFSPTFLLILMIASAQAMHAESPTPARVFAVLLKNPAQQKRDLLMLGIAYAALYIGITCLSFLIDDGLFAKISFGLLDPHDNADLQAAVQQADDGIPSFMYAAIICSSLMMLTAAAFWHAPALIQWHHLSFSRSMYVSFVACLRNWRAFLVYFLVWTGISVGLVLAISILVSLMSMLGGTTHATGDSALTGALTGSFTVFAVLVLSMMMMTSIVFTFRDCFTPPDLRTDTLETSMPD